jgi:transcriptional regulator with XRE-family HTH domain
MLEFNQTKQGGEMTFREQVAIQVKTARLKQGLSQQKLANAAGTSLRQIQRIEHCENDVLVGTLQPIVKALGITLTLDVKR